jgi:Zn-dependent protease with chaperone function
VQGLKPDVYRHSADQEATALLQRIPHFDALMRRLLGLGVARRERNLRLGSSVRLGPDQLPRIWDLHAKTASALGISPIPELYMLSSPDLNAYTIGAEEPIVVLHSHLVEVFDDASLEVVLAHEAGHVHCNHFLYTSVLRVLIRLLSRQETPAFAGLPILALALALTSWQRTAEMSSDRAAGIVTGNPEAVCRTLLGLAAGTAVTDLNLDAFIKQGREFNEPDHPLDTLYRLFDRINSDHPLTVRRVGEFMDWSDAGHLERILRGDFSVPPAVAPSAPPAVARRSAGAPTLFSSLRQPDMFPRASGRRESEFDRLAREYTSQLDLEVAEGSGMTIDEMSTRIERWLERSEG